MARQKPAPTMTDKVVPKGQSARMARGRAAQEKAAANKAAVDRLNARDRAAEAADELTPENIPALSSTERREIYTKARTEFKAVKEAKAAGKKLPATPNLDRLREIHAMEKNTGTKGTKGARRKNGATTRKAKVLDPAAIAKAEKAYKLRVDKGKSFPDIAAELGYPKTREARKAVVGHAKRHHLPDPITRTSATAAEQFAQRAGVKFDPKKFVPATATKKAPTKKAPAKANGAVKKTAGQKEREAMKDVTPIPKKGVGVSTRKGRKEAAKKTVAAARSTRRTIRKAAKK